jgi:carbon monoxide dehydrogenase subunit G
MSKAVVMDVRHIMPGAPQTVWRLITDWEHQDDWMLEASDFVVTSPHREGIGVEAEATVRIGGIRTRDTIRVAAWDPPRRLVIEHRGWVRGTGELHVVPLGEGETRLDWRETLYAPLGPLGWVGLVAFRPLMLRIFRRDLRVLEGLVRRAG